VIVGVCPAGSTGFSAGGTTGGSVGGSGSFGTVVEVVEVVVVEVEVVVVEVEVVVVEVEVVEVDVEAVVVVSIGSGTNTVVEVSHDEYGQYAFTEATAPLSARPSPCRYTWRNVTAKMTRPRNAAALRAPVRRGGR
jgi:hypothetical protein